MPKARVLPTANGKCGRSSAVAARFLRTLPLTWFPSYPDCAAIVLHLKGRPTTYHRPSMPSFPLMAAMRIHLKTSRLSGPLPTSTMLTPSPMGIVLSTKPVLGTHLPVATALHRTDRTTQRVFDHSSIRCQRPGVWCMPVPQSYLRQ